MCEAAGGGEMPIYEGGQRGRTQFYSSEIYNVQSASFFASTFTCEGKRLFLIVICVCVWASGGSACIIQDDVACRAGLSGARARKGEGQVNLNSLEDRLTCEGTSKG